MVEAELTEGGSHFSGNRYARFQAEFLAQRGANGGCGLDDGNDVGISKHLDHIPGMIIFHQGADRADGGTLAAVGAGGISQVHFKGRSNNRRESPVDAGKDATGLYHVTHGFTAPAHDAFVHVAHYGR